MNDTDLTMYVIRALWGHVPPSLRAVSFELVNNKVKFQCILDKVATNDDKELLSMAGTELVADLPPSYDYEEIIEILPYPEEMNNLKNLVYFRHEHNYYK